MVAVAAQSSSATQAGPSNVLSGTAAAVNATARASQRTIVIKLGTSSILSLDTLTPRLSLLSSIVETCHALRNQGHKVVIVCSGAIGVGRMRMGVTEKPTGVGERQALASLGQLRLMALWDNLFHQVGIDVAQILLTRNDIADRPRYLNAKTTLQTLLTTYRAIPIVNENDTVSTSELRFGDNDTLSAITAGLVEADYLFLCTDVDGLYTGNPRSNPKARRLGVVKSVQEARMAVSVDTPGSNFGTGGMQTKLIAAELATAAGVATVIVNSERPADVIDIIKRGMPSTSTGVKSSVTPAESSMASSIASLTEEQASMVGYPPLSEPNHTLFLPTASPLPSRKWSILHALHPSGSIVIDEGAYRRISKHESGGRLLPAGVVAVKGNWERMQAVRLVVRRPITSQVGPSSEAAGVDVGQSVPRASSTSSPSSSMPPTPPVLDSLAHTPTLDPLSDLRRSFSARSSIDSTASATEVAAPTAASAGTSSTGPATASSRPRSQEWGYHEVGRCLANYTSLEVERIKGVKSREIQRILGHADSDYVTDQVALVERDEWA